MRIHAYVAICKCTSMLNSALSFRASATFLYFPSFLFLEFLAANGNDCFVLNLLQACEFLPSPIFSYFAFIIIISIQRGLVHILLSPTPLLRLQSSFSFPLRSLSPSLCLLYIYIYIYYIYIYIPSLLFLFLHIASG